MTKKTNPVARFKNFHWGIPHTHIVQIKDNRFPEHSVEIGKLMELRFERQEQGGNVEQKSLEISKENINKCLVLFDNDHKHDRIYLLLSPSVRKDLKKIYKQLDDKIVDANDICKSVGGHHSKECDYPNIKGKPLGYLTHIVYWTKKKGDQDEIDGTGYVHKMGEEKGGVEPLILISADGNLWIIGGSYYCANAGITN